MDLMVNRIKTRPNIAKLIIALNQSITTLVYILYPVILLMLIYKKDTRFWFLFVVPMISFVILSVFRKKLNAPRPYEVFDYEPILKKETEVASFPSRHVFSIFVISSGIFYIQPLLGSVLLVFGVILALCRFLGGVHFLRDVIAGALCGVFPWALLWAIGLI